MDTLHFCTSLGNLKDIGKREVDSNIANELVCLHPHDVRVEYQLSGVRIRTWSFMYVFSGSLVVRTSLLALTLDRVPDQPCFLFDLYPKLRSPVEINEYPHATEALPRHPGGQTHPDSH